jgi:hypothetical protein
LIPKLATQPTAVSKGVPGCRWELVSALNLH